ncbi:MAG: CBS domain-containing protein [archaeon]
MQKFIRAEEVMSKDVFVVDNKATILTAAKLMVKYKTSSLIAMENTKPKGIITEYDVIQLVVKGEDHNKIPVSKVMSTPIVTVDYEDSFFEVIKLMRNKNFKRIPVLKNNVIVGLINEAEVTKGIIYINKLLNEELRGGMITKDAHRNAEEDMLKNVLVESLKKEPPWVKKQLELLQKISSEQEEVIKKIVSSAKKYTLGDWRINIWSNCEFKFEKMKNNEIIYMCKKLNNFCVYKNCPLNDF